MGHLPSNHLQLKLITLQIETTYFPRRARGRFKILWMLPIYCSVFSFQKKFPFTVYSAPGRFTWQNGSKAAWMQIFSILKHKTGYWLCCKWGVKPANKLQMEMNSHLRMSTLNNIHIGRRERSQTERNMKCLMLQKINFTPRTFDASEETLIKSCWIVVDTL